MNTFKIWTKGLLPLAVVALAACGGDDPFLPPIPEDEVVFAASLGIDLAAMEKIPIGIWITDEVVGDGGLVMDSVVVDAVIQGWIPDGTQFEDGIGQWITAIGAVIPGFDAGVIGMRVGGIRKFVVPPELGFGTRPPSGVPVNSWLIFRVQVTGVLDPNPQGFLVSAAATGVTAR